VLDPGSLSWKLIFSASALALLLSAGTLRPSQASPTDNPTGKPAASQGLPVNTYDLAFVHRFLQPGQYLPLSEVKPGMQGYGLSVFQGIKVERFNFQVIGTVKKLLNGRDALLVRLSGGPLAKNNVIKGMSGSPVYIAGKLVGAISFGYDFSKEPIAGVTPIVDMLDALAPENATRQHIASFHSQPWFAAGPGRTDVAGAAPRIVPLLSPVALVGFSPRAEAFLSDHFQNLGLSVSSGAAGAPDPGLASGSAAALQPGSAVSVLLSTGDFTSVATGTATARFQGQVLAFGHPFLQAGAVDFPMATAYVHDVLPSLFVSFKVASPLSVIGSVVADRPWSVGGQVGRSARMIPATFVVVDETRNIKRTFHCQVVDHPDLTPELLAATTISAIDSTHQSSGPYVARLESHIEAEGIEPIDRIDRFSTNFTAHALSEGMAKFRFVADPVGAFVLRTANDITNNDFRKASIKKVSLNITIQDGHATAALDKVYLEQPFVAPGDTVKVHCVLKPYNTDPAELVISLPVPRDTPDGNLLLGVCSGDEVNAVKKRMGLVEPPPESLRQVVRRIMEKGRGDAVELIAALPEQSLVVNGVKLLNPPAHWSKVFYSNRHTKGPALVRGDTRVAKITNWLIDGSHILTIEVRSPEKVLARQAPYTVPAPSPDENILTTEQAKKAIEAGRKTQSSGSSQSQSSQPAGQPQTPSQAAEKASTSTTQPAAPTVPKEYPHMRPALVWRQDTEEDFRSGKTTGTTVDSWGRLGPGFQDLAQNSLDPDLQVWSGTWSEGSFWFATSTQVWRWKGDRSQPEPMAKFDCLAIPALAADSKGTIYAAAVPGGQIWAIDRKGKTQLVFKLNEPIVTSLCLDDQDNLFVGVAGTGKIYKLERSGKSSLFFDCGQAHILSLFFSGQDHKLYVGTGEKGSVYCLERDGKATALYQSADHLVTGAVRDRKGDLYVATAGQGHLVRVLPSGETQTLASSEAFYTLHYDPASDSVFSGDAEGDITQARIDPLAGQPYFFPVCHTEQEAVLALASDNQERLFAGTANLATVRSFQMKSSAQATYQSAIKDVGRPAQWLYLKAYGALNESSPAVQSDIKAETRSGETSQPDETWSAWQEARPGDEAFTIASPPGRYLQYRLSWRGQPGGSAAPPTRVGRVEVTYLPSDSAPKFSSVSLKPGAALSGKQEISVSGSDPDGDNLLLTIEISADGAKSWQSLAANLRAKRGKSAGKGGAGETPAAGGADKDKRSTGKAGASGKEDDKDSGEASGAEPLKGGIQEEVHPNPGSSGKRNHGLTGRKAPQLRLAGAPGLTPTGSPAGPLAASTELADERPGAGSKGKTPDHEEKEAPKSPDQRPAASQKKPKGGSNGQPGGKATEKGTDNNADKQSSQAETKDTEGKARKLKRRPSRGTSTNLPASPASTSETSSAAESFAWTWETAKQKDGNYILRFTLDDLLSSPEDHAQAVALRAAVVDNTAPEIEFIDSSRDPDGKLKFRVLVTDKLTPIANATYRLDDGEPFALAGLTALTEGVKGTLSIGGVKAGPGSHKLEVKVTDKAGNTATKSFTVK